MPITPVLVAKDQNRRILGLAACQSNFRFRKRFCLKEVRPESGYIRTSSSAFYLHACTFMCTYTHKSLPSSVQDELTQLKEGKPHPGYTGQNTLQTLSPQKSLTVNRHR